LAHGKVSPKPFGCEELSHRILDNAPPHQGILQRLSVVPIPGKHCQSLEITDIVSEKYTEKYTDIDAIAILVATGKFWQNQ
jgi:hypothetical protein